MQYKNLLKQTSTHDVELTLYSDGTIDLSAWDGLGGGITITLEQLRVLHEDIGNAISQLED